MKKTSRTLVVFLLCLCMCAGIILLSGAGRVSTVYMTKDISPAGLAKIYKALGRTLTGKVAVKLSTGEPGGHYFLSPSLIKDLVHAVNGTIVECNTAYGGQRMNTAMHKQVAKDHGFTAIAAVDIMDEEGSLSLPFPNGKYIKEDLVGSHFANYDSFLVLSHFKGHIMGGFRPGPQDAFLESMAEAAGAVMNKLGDKVVYINVMNNLSIDCDCDSYPLAPEMADVGILGSLDPVALDRACVDQVYAADQKQSASLRARMESRNGVHILDHAEALGLGSQKYNLIMVDD